MQSKRVVKFTFIYIEESQIQSACFLMQFLFRLEIPVVNNREVELIGKQIL